LTDLYQLTMLQSYFRERLDQPAVFEFFVRKLPQHRNFLVAAGLEQVLDFVEALQFTPDELDWLRSDPQFNDAFVAELAQLRFTGDIDAMPEGTLFFPNEPILRVTAPLPQAQLIESRVINLLHYQTLIASKAVRCVLAAPDKLLVDFGLRRAHGAEAGLLAARASYLAGFAGTATVLAGMRFGIPSYGTMAHSFVQAHRHESDAFEQFALANPRNVTLLIDTYDTEAAAAKVVALAARLRSQGITIRAVRIDSGDLAAHAVKVRTLLDAAGLATIKIFASGNLDEHSLCELLGRGAPIDGFGIGTRLDVSADAPYLDCAYKLQEYAGLPRRKRSEGKATWPGRKQVYRHYAGDRMDHDVVTLADDPQPGEPLLRPVMRSGRRVAPPESLEDIRKRVAEGMAQLPERLRQLDAAERQYEARIAPALRDLARRIDAAELRGE
jgi:nicotinate phosphoribosyltransferase